MKYQIGNAIATVRKDRGMSQQELEGAIGAAPGHLSRWETGQYFPTAYYLVKMADVLECSVDELLGRDHRG